MRRFAILKFNNMKSYKIPVIWSVTATMEIEAESLEDAILKAAPDFEQERMGRRAEGGRLSTTPDYLDGSFEVDMALLHGFRTVVVGRAVARAARRAAES